MSYNYEIRYFDGDDLIYSVDAAVVSKPRKGEKVCVSIEEGQQLYNVIDITHVIKGENPEIIEVELEKD